MKKTAQAALQGLMTNMLTSPFIIIPAVWAASWICILILLLSVSYVQAETMTGKSEWAVSFTKKKEMVSNFKTKDLDEVIYGMQPGDHARITLKLTNQNDATTDWYMTNKVLYSLEDRSANPGTGGGAYTYRLAYTDPEGKERVIFDSDTVGGDVISPAGEGLKEATDALQDYFYLDRLQADQGGRIDLEVGLDGETQGNDYQDTLADLQMNFAVEFLSTDVPSVSTATTDTTQTTSTTQTTQSTQATDTTQTSGKTTRSRIVKTGDDNNLIPYVICAGVSGLILLFFAIYSLNRRRRDKKGRMSS